MRVILLCDDLIILKMDLLVDKLTSLGGGVSFFNLI
nr:MAG TPA: hypothetical protein [Caudoviricetes sp.]